MKSEFINEFEKYIAIGKEEDESVNRVFGSKEYMDGALELQKTMKQLGLESYIDSVGNIHGIYKTNGNNKEILIGSHMDTVKAGGKFDGLLGVIAGIEVVRKLQESQEEIPYNIHIIGTNGEEGNDLGGTFGSRCMAGLVDVSIESYLDKAKTFGYTKEDIMKAKYDFSNTKCFLELHIEQGNTLYEAAENIGIVTGIVGLQRYKITVEGEANHSGTTLMENRDDALVKAAEIICFGNELAKKYSNNFVATFNCMNIYPNIVAVISNKVEIILECRNVDEDLMNQYILEVTNNINQMKNCKIESFVKKSPVLCDNEIVSIMKTVCENKVIKHRSMPSGATHDGNAIALCTAIGMIFVPSEKGISHAKEEYTSWNDCEMGINVLYDTILNIKQ